MNDFSFLLIIENLTPTAQRVSHEIAWFTVMPDSVRGTTVNPVATHVDVAPGEVPFLVSRVLTAINFFAVAMAIAWRTAPNDVAQFCEGVFLTLAWFWLLCPIQNPWHRTWASDVGVAAVTFCTTPRLASEMVRHYDHLSDEQSRRQMDELNLVGDDAGRSDVEQDL